MLEGSGLGKGCVPMSHSICSMSRHMLLRAPTSYIEIKTFVPVVRELRACDYPWSADASLECLEDSFHGLPGSAGRHHRRRHRGAGQKRLIGAIINGTRRTGRGIAAGSPKGSPDGGKSELRKAGCRVTPGRREATESAAESRPPMAPSGAQARVKGCGKSAPGRWQQGSHGKPHPEQGQIGDEGPPVPPESRVGRSRFGVIRIPDK